MHQYTEDPLLEVYRPKPSKFGRRAGWRDRLIGVAVIAALVVGLWFLVRPTPFTTIVTEEHVLGAGVWTVFKGRPEYTVFVSKSGTSTTLLLSIDKGNASILNLADEVEDKLASDLGETQDVARLEFSNVILVCDRRSTCESIKKSITRSAQRIGITDNSMSQSSRFESRKGQLLTTEILDAEFVIPE